MGPRDNQYRRIANNRIWNGTSRTTRRDGDSVMMKEIRGFLYAVALAFTATMLLSTPVYAANPSWGWGGFTAKNFTTDTVNQAPLLLSRGGSGALERLLVFP